MTPYLQFHNDVSHCLDIAHRIFYVCRIRPCPNGELNHRCRLLNNNRWRRQHLGFGFVLVRYGWYISARLIVFCKRRIFVTVNTKMIIEPAPCGHTVATIREAPANQGVNFISLLGCDELTSITYKLSFLVMLFLPMLPQNVIAFVLVGDNFIAYFRFNFVRVNRRQPAGKFAQGKARHITLLPSSATVVISAIVD